MSGPPSPPPFVIPSVGNGGGSSSRWRRKRGRREGEEGKGMGKVISSLSKCIRAANSFINRHDLRLLPSQTIALRSLICSINKLLSSLLLLSSSSSSSSPLLPPPPFSSSSCWFNRFLSHPVSHQDPTQWSDAFNMSQQSFNLLLSTLSPHLPPSTPPHHALASSLFRLSHGLPHSSLSPTWFPSPSPLSFYVVCKSIIQQLHFFSDRNTILRGFHRLSLPNCCGVLAIRCFPTGGDGDGVMALTVVDSEMRFVEASVGWPSNMKRDLIMRQSRLFGESKEEGGYLLCDSNHQPHSTHGNENQMRLPWLLPPFPEGEEGLPAEHARFNVAHALGMEVGGMAITSLCRRWKILSTDWSLGCRKDFLPYVFVTCCLLHNFLIDNNNEYN